MWKLGDRRYNSVLEITRPRSFISGNTLIGTRHLYRILTSPSFAVLPAELGLTIGWDWALAIMARTLVSKEG
jgi:hypothetical protein